MPHDLICILYKIQKLYRRLIMIKTFKQAALTLAVVLACSTAAFADGSAFTPLNFDDDYYNYTCTHYKSARYCRK